MRLRLARVAAVAALALSASFFAPSSATAAQLQPGVIDHNATDWVEDWSIDPRADIALSQSGYVIVALRNFGTAVGYEILLDGTVVETPYLERGGERLVYLDDVPLGGEVIVTAADGYELARFTVPSEND